MSSDRRQLLREVTALRADGESIRTIAARLGVHRSRVERALRAVQDGADGTPTHASGRRALGQPAPFVGRREVLEALKRRYRAALSGRGQIVMLSGEMGIGKTRAAQALADHARRRGGVTVVEGACYEREGAPPYWPWIQVLRSCLRRQPPAGQRSPVARKASVLLEILPELSERLPDPAPLSPLDTRAAQFRLFDVVASYLKEVSQHQPLVIVLDDLHRADGPSLLLLEFLGSALREDRVLLLGTCRDTDAGPDDLLAEVLGMLGRQRHFQRISLQGLRREDVAACVEAMTGVRAPPAFTAGLFERTAGNPLFVTEIVRHLSQADPHSALPERWEWVGEMPPSVREAVRLRLKRLSPDCQEALTLAAVLGLEFEQDQLAWLAGSAPDDRLSDLLEEARAARLVEHVRGMQGRCRFTHAIVRDTLADALPRAQHDRLHGRIVELFEALGAEHAERHAAKLVYHCRQAAALVGPEKLARYATLAGEQALAAYAHDQALAYFQTALDARGTAPLDTGGARLLLGIGRAQAARASYGGSRRDLEWASHLFETFVAQERWPEAVEAMENLPPAIAITSEVSEARLGQLKRSVARMPAGSPEAARALSIYGELTGMAGNYDEARASIERALAFAQEGGDRRLELHARTRKATVDYYHWRTELEDCDRIMLLARQLQDPLREVHASWLALIELAENANAAMAVSMALRGSRMAEAIHSPYYAQAHWGGLSVVHRNQGAWDEARSAIDRALSGGPPGGTVFAMAAFLEFQAGDFARGEAYLQQRSALVDWASPVITFDHVGVAATASFAARATGEVRWLELSERAASHPLADHDTTMAAQYIRIAAAHNAFLRHDAAAAAAQYRYFTRQHGTAWCRMAGPTPISTQRLFGLLCRTAGDVERAIEHFEAALAFCRRTGVHPELAWTCFDYAETLAARAGAQDRPQADALLEEAGRVAAELRMGYLEDRIAALRERLNPLPVRCSYPDGLSPREVEVLRLLAEGRTNAQIARAIYVSPHTVANHVQSIFNKINVGNRTEAATYALRHGLMTPE